MKTAIQQAIEKYEFRLAIEKQLIDFAGNHNAKNVHRNRASVLEKCIFDLQSLLPAEQSQIKAAYMEDRSDEPKFKSASDYYLTTFTSPDGDKSKEK